MADDAVHQAGFICLAFEVQPHGLLPIYCRVENRLTHQAHNLRATGANPVTAPIWRVLLTGLGHTLNYVGILNAPEGANNFQMFDPPRRSTTHR